MRFLLPLALLLVAGCATVNPPRQEWVATRSVDAFTDVETCMVTFGRIESRGAYQEALSFYPFVGFWGADSLTVGVRSGGAVRVPVGDVQMRIDAHDAWTITTAETPLTMIPAGLSETAAGETYARALSPFTSTTGERAAALLRQMEGGAVIRYRVLAVNQAGSSTGEVPLGEAFRAALTQCRGASG